VGISLNTLYSLYHLLGSSRNRYLVIRLAKAMGFRHRVVRMDTNFLCNLKCQTCYFSGPNIKPMLRKPMSEEQFRRIAAEVFPQTRVLFLSCGGEPLMTKEFGKFLDIVSEYRVPYTAFVTNAILFKQETVDAVVRNRVNEIIISIDGATKKTYEYIRQGANFDVLLEKLQMLKEAREGPGKGRPALRFNFTITRSNYAEMGALVDLAQRFGVSTIKFRHYIDWGGKFNFDAESLQGHEQSFNQVLAEALSKAANYGIRVFSPNPFSEPGKRRSRLATVEELIDSSPRPPCVMPWFHLYVSPEGFTRPCGYLPVGTHSLFEHSLREIEQLPESLKRKESLLRAPKKSCLATVCNGEIMRRADADSDNLAQYNSAGLVEDELKLHQVQDQGS